MPLQPISGLYVLQQRCRVAAAACEKESGEQELHPREKHEARQQMEAYMKQADGFGAHIKSNEELIQNIEQLIQNIEQLIHYLVNSPIKSAQRTLTLRKLEEASGHLRRECGSTLEEIAANQS